jgi:CheY-like chemotaxis protein
MWQRVLAGLIVAAVGASASTDLRACGDKFLRAGRSARTKGYAAVYPAAILIYKPNATAKGLQEFESLLRKAGHKPVALKDGAALSQTLTSAKYDVIIADYADTELIKGQFSSASAEPGLLPILHNASKAQEAEVAKHYHCVLKPEKMTKYDALEQIDHVMELRRKSMTGAAAK